MHYGSMLKVITYGQTTPPINILDNRETLITKELVHPKRVKLYSGDNQNLLADFIMTRKFLQMYTIFAKPVCNYLSGTFSFTTYINNDYIVNY